MTRVLLSLTLLLTTTSLWADDVGKLRQKLSRETDAGKRAKISVKIGRELLKETRKLYKAESFGPADSKLQEYVSTVSAAFDGLQSSGLQARKKPRGFKDLEIHLRKSRRTLEDVSRTIPFDGRDRIKSAIQKLRTMRSELLQALMAEKPKEREGG